MTDPNATLAASVAGHLVDAGLIRTDEEAAVAEALASGQASPGDWVRWIENGAAAKGKPVA